MTEYYVHCLNGEMLEFVATDVTDFMNQVSHEMLDGRHPSQMDIFHISDQTFGVIFYPYRRLIVKNLLDKGIVYNNAPMCDYQTSNGQWLSDCTNESILRHMQSLPSPPTKLMENPRVSGFLEESGESGVSEDYNKYAFKIPESFEQNATIMKTCAKNPHPEMVKWMIEWINNAELCGNNTSYLFDEVWRGLLTNPNPDAIQYVKNYGKITDIVDISDMALNANPMMGEFVADLVESGQLPPQPLVYLLCALRFTNIEVVF